MEDIEKDLDKVAGGFLSKDETIIENKDGKFVKVRKDPIGNKIIEGKNGEKFVVDDLPLAFDNRDDACKVRYLIDEYWY